jgi:hypothetical protein
MARSASEIALAIATDMLDADPTVDTNKGPFYDIAIVPPSNEIAAAESEADTIATLYSRFADRAGTMADTEIAALGRAFKVATPSGQKAKVLLTFYMTTLPTTTVSIPTGVPVASSDGVYVFVTTTSIPSITSTTAGAYLDASTGRYLFNVEAEAVAVGGGYNLPARRIVKMMMSVTGIAGVYNAVASTGGADANTTDSYLSQVQDTFLARDLSTLSGLVTDIARRGISQSVVLVDSTKRDSFFRPVQGSAVDVYLIQPDSDTYEDVFSPVASNTYQLTRSPVLSIDAVYINGVALSSASYTFRPDTTPAYRRSASATDVVKISSTLTSSDVIRIRYSYASSVYSLQSTFDAADVMGADILIRLTNALYVTVTGQIVCPSTSLSSITTAAQTYLTTNFGSSFKAADMTAYLTALYPEIQLIRWSVFGRRGRTGIETVNVPTGLSLAFKDSSDLQLQAVGV